MEKLFDKMDTNTDKKLSQQEVFQYLQQTGFTFNASDVTDFWTIADHNRDGFLTAKEIKKAVKNVEEGKRGEHNLSLAYSKNQKVNLIFYYYDVNKSNFLEKSEV